MMSERGAHTRRLASGYIAVARSIFEHPLFEQERALSRMEAWQWLIAKAAWKSESHRTRRALVHVVRGELAASLRSLGKSWGWPKSNVARFLARLKREGMVGIKKAPVNAGGGTQGGTVTDTAVSIITICNYDVFQHAAKKVGQRAGHKAGQSAQDSLPFQDDISANQHNHSNQESKRAGDEVSNRAKPPHRARSRDGKFVWFDHASEEWGLHAADFRRVRLADLLPESRIGGRGNWFVWLGEAARPQRRRRA